jgi:uncharacterized protein YlxW (UPF0749 family)
MANRSAPTHISGLPTSVPGLDVEKVKISLRKPFDLPSRYRWLTLVGLVLGLFISVEWQTPVAKAPVTSDYPRELGRETIQRLEAEQKELKQIIADRRTELAAVQKDAASRKSALAGLNTELETQRILAGMVPMVGPGVQVILDDSNVKSIPQGEDPSHYIVHDYDIRDVVALLWQSGAEAIAIGDERVVGSTSIYCVGSTILVNETRMSPPYKIVAIGPPSMEEALNSPAHLQSLKAIARQYGIQLKISQAKEVQTPAFSGRFPSRFMQPGGSS